jgi:hypothetical protein
MNRVCDEVYPIVGLAPVAPSTSVPDYVSLKDVENVDVVVCVKNGATVTGSAITLKQASAVANTGEKALAFTQYYSVTDPANTCVPASATAASNTFTTANTNNASLLYIIPVNKAMLDTANSFDCIRAGTGDATNATVCVLYNVRPSYGANVTNVPNAVVD